MTTRAQFSGPHDMPPFVTAIVPVRNEELFLATTLRLLLTQDYDHERFEILVVDGQSSDNTVGIVRQYQRAYPQLKLLFNPRRLSSAARNIGVRQSSGELIVIVDGHCELRGRTYFADLVAAFAQSGADCLGRPQPLEIRLATSVQRAIALARASRLGHNPGSHIYSDIGGFVRPQSVGIAYRKSVFERIGLFDEQFDACEDVEFNHRVDAAGMTCFFAPELAVAYRPRETLAGLAYQMQRYGRGRARLLLKHPKSLTVPSLVPAMFLIGIVGAFVIGLFAPLFASVFCLTALIYSAAVTFVGMWHAARGRSVELTPLLPAVFLAIHVGAGWGVLAELTPSLARRMLNRLRPVARNLRPA